MLAVVILSATNAAAATDAELERQFARTVRPFLATYCTGCHAGEKPQANLDLGQYSTVESVVRDYGQWTQVVEKLAAKAMPPKVAKQPPDGVRRNVIDWVNDLKKHEVAKNAGDPGRVLARRLSNAEYDYTIRYERISRWHVEQYAYLASKLDSMPEGDGTVLDNSCLMFLSNLWIGRRHDNSRLPLVLAGGLGGTLQTGRTLDYLKAGDHNRKMCSLYLSIMDRMGLKLERFGNADQRLEGL